ncbi:MAG TPA: glycosyltransferase [Capillimicrobium sp.]|nr:glycosyltransferase [Capillimicrobium sp.]
MLHHPDPRVAVVIIVRDGRARLERTLERLTALPERPPVIVVDNASSDGTVAAVRSRFPEIRVIELGENRGAAGRNAGVAAAEAPYVAFAEDDSWYEPGALRAAADVLDAHPAIALVNAHVEVGEERRPDPLHDDMVGTPLPDDGRLPGHRILSFLEGVSIVRREAFLSVGGFDPRLGVGGPEEHLAADLLAAGWQLRYVPAVRARHVPQHGTPPERVRRLGLRNALWFAWTRRPAPVALRWTVHLLRDSPRSWATAGGLLDALRWLPRLPLERRPLPPAVERDMALLDGPKMASAARRYGRPRPRPRPRRRGAAGSTTGA